MKKQKSRNRLLRLFRFIYLKLFRIHDTPQKVALGFGLGAFSGIFPGTGPLAALFLAFILRANRASALMGSLATNTWLSFVTFLLSIKVGSAIMRLDWQQVRSDWILFLKDFRWLNLLRLSALKIILPVIVGYLVVAFFLGLATYIAAYIVIKTLKKK